MKPPSSCVEYSRRAASLKEYIKVICVGFPADTTEGMLGARLRNVLSRGRGTSCDCSSVNPCIR